MSPAPDAPPRNPARRTTVKLGVIGLGLAVASLLWSFGRPANPVGASDTSIAAPVGIETTEIDEASAMGRHEAEGVTDWSSLGAKPAIVPGESMASRPQEGPSSVHPVVATKEASALVRQVLDLEALGDGIDPEAAEGWKEAFAGMIQAGDSAVPLLREFLERDQDLNLLAVAGGPNLGHASLRTAIIDALGEMQTIGAEFLLADTLARTADPAEVARISAHLEAMAPGQYRAQALQAANEVLRMAASGQLPGHDVGPVFDLMGRMGDGTVAEDLASVTPLWGYYTPLALANLPEGGGVPALRTALEDPAMTASLNSEFLVRMLAQSSRESGEAIQALMDLARSDRMTPKSWTAVAEGLSGFTARIETSIHEPALSASNALGLRRYHIAAGNQNFTIQPPESMSKEEMLDRIGLLNEFLALAPGPDAEEPLRRQLERLVLLVAD